MKRCDDFMKLRLSSSGCETRPVREPARPVVSLALEAVTPRAMRRCTNVRAAEKCSHENYTSREPKDLFVLKAIAISLVAGMGRPLPAGCWTAARTKRTTQAPGRPRLLLVNPAMRRAGDQTPTAARLRAQALPVKNSARTR